MLADYIPKKNNWQIKSIFSNSNAISAISILCSKQAASLFFPMFKRNKNVRFRSFCTYIYIYIYLMPERCRKPNNVWLHALMQSDCLYSSLSFEHYNSILLYDWVLGRCSVCLRACTRHNSFVLFLALIRVGLSVQLWMQCCTKCYGLANSSVKKVSLALFFYLQHRYKTFCCVSFDQSALCRLYVFVLYELRVCFKTLKLKLKKISGQF